MDQTSKTKYQLERHISEIIYKDNGCTAHFILEYIPYNETLKVPGSLEVKIVTLNPAHIHFYCIELKSKYQMVVIILNFLLYDFK